MQEEKSALGSINIHQSVIAQIAQAAILEVEGVSGLAHDFKNNIFKLFGSKDASGIKVIISGNEDVRLNIAVIVKYGVNIPDVANKIQENVKLVVEKMTNLTLQDINVNIRGIKGGVE